MWMNLEQRYAVTNIPKVHRLKASMAECKQGGMEVVDFYAKLASLWSELENHVRAPRCTCYKCECNINTRLDKAAEEEKSHQFLMGLNDDVYSAIRSQILGLEPMPSPDRIFNMVSQEENHKTYMISKDDRREAAFSQ